MTISKEQGEVLADEFARHCANADEHIERGDMQPECVDFGAFVWDNRHAIRDSLRSPGIDREAVLEEAASDEMVEALAEEFCLAGFSEGVQAVLREDDPSYWSKITPDAQESYRRGVRAILAAIRAFKTTPNEPVVEDRGEAE